MKRVITLLAASLMTLLIGCSFAKNDPQQEKIENITTAKKVEVYELSKVTDIESAIKFLPSDNIKPYFKEIPTGKLNVSFSNGKNAIEVALERGNESVLRDLLDLGASPFIKNLTSKKSAYELGTSQEYYNTRNDLRNFATFPNIFQAIRSKYRAKMKSFLDKKMFNEYILEVQEKHLPCEELVTDIIEASSRSVKFEIPNDVISKIINTPSCKENLEIKKVQRYFIQEFKNQFKRNFPSLLVLEFLSKKSPQNIFYLDLSFDANKAIVINPAALIMWGIQGKSFPKLSEKLSQIYNFANFPSKSAIIISKSNQRDPADGDTFMTLEELLKTQDAELLEALRSAYGYYEGILEEQFAAGVVQ